MRVRARFAQWASVLTTCWLALVAPTAAQDRASQMAYQRLITDAVGEFDAGRWEEARALFAQAHEIAPSARTLRGMGMCAFELRDYDEAVRLLSEALLDTRRPLTRRQRTEVEDLVRRARAFLGRFRIVTEPPGATIWIDDAPVAPDAEGVIALEVGMHVIEARLDGHAPLQRRLEVRGEEDETLTLALDPLAPAPVVIASTTPVEAIAMFVGAGGALLLEIAAIGWMVDRLGQLDACASPPAGFGCANRPTLVEQRDAAIATTVVAAVTTLGLAGAGAALWLVHEGGGAADDRLACSVGMSGLACAGRFW
ncbi:MAG: hypothetical protein OHK0013_49110 [Sandaracinaceae bacterium]